MGKPSREKGKPLVRLEDRRKTLDAILHEFPDAEERLLVRGVGAGRPVAASAAVPYTQADVVPDGVSLLATSAGYVTILPVMRVDVEGLPSRAVACQRSVPVSGIRVLTVFRERHPKEFEKLLAVTLELSESEPIVAWIPPREEEGT